MHTKEDLHFYNNLNEYRQSISELLQKESLFRDVPANWHVVLTDIKSSTKAIEAGKHEALLLF
mgnify:FL=1